MFYGFTLNSASNFLLQAQTEVSVDNAQFSVLTVTTATLALLKFVTCQHTSTFCAFTTKAPADLRINVIIKFVQSNKIFIFIVLKIEINIM